MLKTEVSNDYLKPESRVIFINIDGFFPEIVILKVVTLCIKAITSDTIAENM